MRNTIKKVTKNLNPELRDSIRRLWEQAGVMDLDYPNLSTYIDVITQRVESLQAEVAEADEKLLQIRKLTK